MERVANRFQAIAHEPVQRLIRVHAKSVAHARKARACDRIAPACCQSDARQCRIVINALRREIDRLLRGIDPRRPFWIETQRGTTDLNLSSAPGESAAQELEFTQRAAGIPPRKTYAPPALGDRAALLQLFRADRQAMTPASSLAPSKASGAIIDLLA